MARSWRAVFLTETLRLSPSQTGLLSALASNLSLLPLSIFLMLTGPAWSQKLRTEIAKAVIGQDAVVERLGHIRSQ